MTTVLAIGLAIGVPLPVVAILGVGIVAPGVGLALVVAWVIADAWSRRVPTSGSSQEVAWLGAVAGELRSGASLRAALAEATVRIPLTAADAAFVRRLRSGAPVASMADHLTAALPTMGRLVASAVRIGAVTGGHSAVIFSRLAVRAAEVSDIARQQSSATAAVRLSAWVVGAIPVVLIAGLTVSGRIGAVVASGPVGLAAVLLGVGLQVAGFVAVVVVSKRVMP